MFWLFSLSLCWCLDCSDIVGTASSLPKFSGCVALCLEGLIAHDQLVPSGLCVMARPSKPLSQKPQGGPRKVGGAVAFSSRATADAGHLVSISYLLAVARQLHILIAGAAS